MDPQTLGVLIGGFLPAVIYAIGGVSAKASTQAGIGIGPYVLWSGLAVFVCGLIAYYGLADRTSNFKSGGYAFINGVTWAIGTGLVAVGIQRYGVPVSKLAPIYNMNTLFVVLLGMWIFREYEQLNVLKLAAGTVLMVLGSVLVTKA